MAVRENIYFLPLDENGRPLDRLDGDGEWREIVRELLRLGSRWLIVEQQRQGERAPHPRRQDIRLSRELCRRLRPMEMRLADHVIHGRGNRFSFREAGLL